MIWVIAKREFLEYLKSLRFLIGFVVTVALVALCTIINVNDYTRRLAEYSAACEELSGTGFYVQVYRPPEVLSTLVQGKDRSLGNRLEFTYMHLPPNTSGYMGELASQHHRYLAGFASVDLAFVVRVVLSLLVIFISYGAVSQEKQHGTLRLILASAIPRHAVIMGKLLGGLTVVLAMMLVSILVALLILTLHPAVMLISSDWARVAAITGVSALYLTCFFTMSLFVSVLINRPSIALTVLLQVWIVISIIYPNLAIRAAESLYPLPGEEELLQQKAAAFQPYESEQKGVREAFHQAVVSGGHPSSDLMYRNVELSAREAELNYEVDLEFGRRLSRQVDVARTISLFSPPALYDQQTAWYAKKVAQTYQHPSTISTQLYVAPNPLLFMAESGDKYRPVEYRIQPMGFISPLPGGPRNYKMPDVPDVDWAFIIKVLFSLYVLLLGYDAICGEKDRGTLRQILANPTGRVRLLAAKYAAILLTVLVPLIIGALTSMIIIALSTPSILTAGSIARIALIIALAVVYLSVFAFLSLVVSSLIHQPSVALLTLLVVWVFFVVIVPNTAGIIADGISDVPSEYEMAKRLGPLIQEQVWAKIGQVRKRVDAGDLKTEDEVRRETDRAFEEGQQDLIRHSDEYNRAMQARGRLARDLSRISPTALFQYASESIAGTGIHREEQFREDARSYSSVYDAYILKKVGKLVGVSTWSFSTNMMIQGKPVYIRSPYPVEYQGDKSDFPRFVERRRSGHTSVQDAMHDSIGLILWNVALALASFWAIQRADVR